MASIFLEKLELFVKKLKETEFEEAIQIQEVNMFIKKYEYSTMSDDEIINMLETLRELDDDLELKNVYDLEFMMSLDERIITKWIELDNNSRYTHKLVNNVCYKMSDNKYIIWLIEKGFPVDYVDTYNIVKNNNFELLKYYHQKGFEIHYECPYNAIKNGNLEILKYIFDNGLIYFTIDEENIKRLFQYALCYNQINILNYLINEQKFKLTKEFINFNITRKT